MTRFYNQKHNNIKPAFYPGLFTKASHEDTKAQRNKELGLIRSDYPISSGEAGNHMRNLNIFFNAEAQRAESKGGTRDTCTLPSIPPGKTAVPVFGQTLNKIKSIFVFWCV